MMICVKSNKNLVLYQPILGRIEGCKPVGLGEKPRGRGPTYPRRELN